MTQANAMPGLFEGGCHCGAVRFRVDVQEFRATLCNCSMCRKKGIIHYIVPKERFTLLSGEADLTTYTFNTGVARHTFCRHCGIHAFYVPRSHPDGFSVNLRCLDEDLVARFEIGSFDGQHWEASIESLRGAPTPAGGRT